MLTSTNVSAQEFLNTEPAEHLFNLGVRVGVNTSNRTFSKDYFREWNVNSWGTGFDAGVVVNLNMRDWFAIQPGFFFESRSGNYAYAENYFDRGEPEKFTELGHYRTYNFIVPIMASFRFNLSPTLRWICEAGPYGMFKLKSSDNDKIQVIDPQQNANDPLDVNIAKTRFFDFGLKIGTGFEFKRRYSVNVHYMAGARSVWNEPHSGGHHKAWVATVGYDF